MEIIENKEFRQQILDRIAKREFYERTGIHCSDLIYCLNKQALRKLKPIPNTDEEILIFSVGWSTQRWLTGKDEDEPEREVDGIIVTLDALRRELVEEHPSDRTKAYAKEVPWELKATYQSSTRPIEENIHWIRQIMAQCYVTHTTSACLSRLEIMGDWKFVFGKKEEKATAKRPTLHAYKLEFTLLELDKFWQWMKERKVLYEEILRTSVLMPKIVALASGMPWECSFCSYQEECNATQSV